MPYFAVDDQITFHPKAIAAGNAAMGVWTRAGAWAKANTTGGFVSAELAHALGKKESARLVTAGLWREGEHPKWGIGYYFHDWTHTSGNGTEEEEKERRERDRERARERKRAQRERDAAARHAVGHGVTPGDVPPTPSPSPIPIETDVTTDGPESHEIPARDVDDPIEMAMRERHITNLGRVRRAFSDLIDEEATDGEVIDLAGMVLDRSRKFVTNPEAYIEVAVEKSADEIRMYAAEARARSPRAFPPHVSPQLVAVIREQVSA
jgi:hypothetical protein